ncbi:uncharacterized protein LOC132307838 isoform X2 [Cornus florida]|uniref:uncharacterized protein LOC132307838 isoform X2 n=1 Tax=Cornus florida TaxID=4283 RepID=UPI0028966997|nr:uncharacterized protein LOC132307838 isoform X2 [Cornus florida]
MAENPELENVDSDTLNSSWELEETGSQKISVSDQTNSLQYTNMKHDSFIVDMERFPQQTHKDLNANSRITRSLSRIGSQRGGEKKIKESSGNERDVFLGTSTPRAALGGASVPEKSMVVTVGATDHPISPQVHHQITIITGGNISSSSSTTTTTESKCGGKRFSFRRSSPSCAIDPRKILFFFATLSSMGTILLIYFTLSMGKLNGDGDALNW